MENQNTNFQEESEEYPYVIFKIKDELYAVTSQYVKEIVQALNIYSVPNNFPYMKGVINLRGEIINIVDFRTYLNYNTHQSENEEIINILNQDEQDHKNWIEELIKSTHDNTPFKLTTNPHECTFGKWYDKFQTDNYILKIQLQKFDKPHRRIHALGDEVEELKSKRQFAEALDLIHQTKTTEFNHLIQLFAATRDILNTTVRDVALIIEFHDTQLGLIVDSIISVENIAQKDFTDSHKSKHVHNHKIVSQFATVDKYSSVVSIIDPLLIEV